MRPFTLTTRMMAISTMSLALAAYAPRAIAQTGVVEAPAASGWLCTVAAANPELACVTVFAAGCCVGYGIFKGLEYCWPETFIGPKDCPAPNPLPPPKPTTPAGCKFFFSLCWDTAHEPWDEALKACEENFPDSVEECMAEPDKKLNDDLKKCQDDYKARLKRIGVPVPNDPWLVP
jgi:hypothetical protein